MHVDKKKKNKNKNPCCFMGCIGLNDEIS